MRVNGQIYMRQSKVGEHVFRGAIQTMEGLPVKKELKYEKC